MKLFQSSLFLGIFLILIQISTCSQSSKHLKSETHGSPRFILMDLPGKVFESVTTVLGSLTDKAFTTLMDRTCRKLMRYGVIGESCGISKYDVLLHVPEDGDIKETFPLSSIKDLADSELYSENKTLIVFIPGGLTDLSQGIPVEVRELADAFGQRPDITFAILDFGKCMQMQGTLYSLAALNTEEIGRLLGEALAELHRTSNIGYLHLIGDYLGAHVAASAAEKFSRRTGQDVDRITGLDPARACFKQGSQLPQLTKDSANFVDLVFTTNALAAADDPKGHANFFVKGYKDSRLPGCDDRSTRICCSHKRSLSVFAECSTPDLEQNCLACRCKSNLAFNNKKCKKCTTPFGWLADPSETGTFFLQINSRRPYFPCKKRPATTTTTARTTTTEESSSTDSTSPSTDTDPTIPPNSTDPTNSPSSTDSTNPPASTDSTTPSSDTDSTIPPTSTDSTTPSTDTDSTDVPTSTDSTTDADSEDTTTSNEEITDENPEQPVPEET